MAADGITITEERAKTVDFSKGYITVDQRLMSRLDDARLNSVDQAKANKTIKIGTQKGTTNFDLAKELWSESQIVAYDQFPEAVQALINGDVDIVIIDDTAGIGYTGANKDKVRLLEGALVSQELGFVFAKGSPLTAAFDAALDAMRADGTLETLNKKWFTPSE
jgi:polar amino acid transport system substrate-binding protein